MITTTDPIYFNSFNLNNIEGWFTSGTSPYRYPSRDVKSSHLAFTDRSETTSAFHTGKALNVTGSISRTTRELLDDSISQLREVLEPKKKTLQLPVSGQQRVFPEVTVKNIIISDVKGGHANIDIEFVLSEIYNYETTTTELLNSINQTSGNKSFPITVGGKGDQVPIITYTLDSGSPLTNRTVTFTNPGDSTSIAIQRTWTANEVLVINCKEQTITVDGDNVDFTGNFLTWSTGEQFINYTDDFTTRQADINVTYTKRYL